MQFDVRYGRVYRPPNSPSEIVHKVAFSQMLISEASSLVKRDAMPLGENFSTAVLLLLPSDPEDGSITVSTRPSIEH